MLRCPKCKGTKFSVRVEAYQIFYGNEREEERWGEVDVGDVDDGNRPYLCCECEREYDKEDLEEFKE